MTISFFWCKFSFRKYFGVSGSNHWAGHCQWSCKIYFSSQVTIQLRNRSWLLHRIREDDNSKQCFVLFCLIFSQLTRHPHIKFYHLSICFKCRMPVEWLTLSSWANSHVVVEDQLWWWPLIDVITFRWPATMLFIFKTLVSFAKLLEPWLYIH